MDKKEKIKKESEELDVKQRTSRIKFLESLLKRPIERDSGLFEIFLASRGSSCKLWHDLNYGKWVDWKEEDKKDEHYRKRMEVKRLKSRYYNFVHVLRKDRILSSDNTVTVRGKRWLKEALVKQKRKLPSPQSYEIIETSSVIIVSYDIPEKYKYLRKWVQRVLRALDFEMLQKSVFIGNRILPKRFIDDLRALGLLDCVHIAAVLKTGTMRVV